MPSISNSMIISIELIGDLSSNKIKTRKVKDINAANLIIALYSMFRIIFSSLLNRWVKRIRLAIGDLLLIAAQFLLMTHGDCFAHLWTYHLLFV